MNIFSRTSILLVEFTYIDGIDIQTVSSECL